MIYNDNRYKIALNFKQNHTAFGVKIQRKNL